LALPQTGQRSFFFFWGMISSNRDGKQETG